MKILFFKYTTLTAKSNYFDRSSGLQAVDRLLITKHIKFSRMRKQLTSPEDFSQIQYGDTDVELSLLNTETSANGNTILQFFDDYVNYINASRSVGILCIIDSGRKRWACFINESGKANFSYADDNSSFIFNIKAYDAMTKWKALAETLIPNLGTGGVGNGNYFDEYMMLAVMGSTNFSQTTFAFQNDVDVTAITGAQCRINKPLLAGILEGGNESFTIYNLVKDLAVSWGLVYKFEVPEDYEAQAENGAIPLTFRLMRRTDGNAVTMKPLDHYRTYLPKAGSAWILLINRQYTVRTHINSTVYVEADVAYGVLTNGVITYNYDSYNMNSFRTIPNIAFVLSVRDINSQGTIEDPVYKDKITVMNDAIALQIPINNVKVISSPMYNVEIANNYQSFVNSKKFGEDVFVDNQSAKRINNKVAAHRIFCSSYFNWDGTEPGLDDIMYQLNVLPANELQVMLKSRGSIEGITSIMNTEPDLFDTFTVPYNGTNEVHSIISIEPNYNVNDGAQSMTAEYQTARIA